MWVISAGNPMQHFSGASYPSYPPPASPFDALHPRGHTRPTLTVQSLTGQSSYRCGWSTLALVLAGLAGLALGGWLGFSIANAAQVGTAFGLWSFAGVKEAKRIGEGMAAKG